MLDTTRAAGGSIWNHKTSADDVPLYSGDQVRALAAVREPLSDEQILIAFDEALELECDVTDAEVIDFARAIERAHGIGITAQAQQEGK